MSPEQAQGLEVDAKTDQFSVGSVLYELCAGKPAFTGANPLSILRSIADTQPQPIRELNPEVPEWLGDVIHRLMAKSPAERFASVSDVAELFEFHWLLLKTSSQNIPVAAVEMCESKHRAQRWSRAGAAAAIFAAGVAFGMLLNNWRTSANLSTTESLEQQNAASVEQAANPFVRGVPTVQSQSVLKANSGSVWSVVFSPDGDSLAMAVEDGNIRFWDIAEQRLTKTLNAHRGIVWLVTYSPDGSRFASSGDDGELHIWDAKSFEKTQTLVHPNAIRSLLWFADGRRIASSDRAGNLIVWDVDLGEKLLERHLESAVYSIALTNDGRTLATAGTDSVIRLWDPETLEERVTLSGHAGPVFGLDFHPDNTKLASVGWDKKLHLWDVGSGTEISALEGHSGDAWYVDFAPGGESLVTAGQDGIAIQWDARSGRKIAVLAGHQAALHTVAFDHESSRIATGSRDGTVRIWPVQRDATP
jgi:WD40 repeat protein